MRRTRDIVGLPVLDLKSGRQVGWVQDIVFDPEQDRVSGVLLEGGHFFQSSKGIPRQTVARIGKDALVVTSFQLKEILGIRWSQKVGNPVYTEGGQARGKIADVFLDDFGERIVGYEVSDGLFADLVQGRGTILQQHVVVEGKNVLIVGDQVVPWGENGGGSLS
ncbi:MAG: PRC-barrel domain-containing protein [Desulfitobacteriaceae bacterium]